MYSHKWSSKQITNEFNSEPIRAQEKELEGFTHKDNLRCLVDGRHVNRLDKVCQTGPPLNVHQNIKLERNRESMWSLLSNFLQVRPPQAEARDQRKMIKCWLDVCLSS
ncbi:hypothetical protein Y1Q_0003213 [Alligator mississippiensis]|uniref:Uncharacterized protein n=1 Tax=Alligator mississippiensis TaxID=8496 RepID=A0A151ME89_ALLMI|nr:hypothetical protein Y1Q_0003213 [Alligator mississippiensis]